MPNSSDGSSVRPTLELLGPTSLAIAATLIIALGSHMVAASLGAPKSTRLLLEFVDGLLFISGGGCLFYMHAVVDRRERDARERVDSLERKFLWQASSTSVQDYELCAEYDLTAAQVTDIRTGGRPPCAPSYVRERLWAEAISEATEASRRPLRLSAGSGVGILFVAFGLLFFAEFAPRLQERPRFSESQFQTQPATDVSPKKRPLSVQH